VDRASFEQHLRAEGFPEIRTNQMPAGCHNDEHVHEWDVLALVLEGDITLTVDGQARTYKAGDQFSMEAGCRHVEDVGPQGVKYLVGRRPVSR
jgi:quercetin dioxygenase-like cupin family protein